MGTKQENAVRRESHVEKTRAQLDAWSTQLDDLVVRYLKASSQPNDAYRVRIERLRTRVEAVRAKLDGPAGDGPWGAFQAAIKDDWKAIEAGLEDLTR